MTMASPRGFPTMTAFPRSLSSIAVSVGGLAIFLTLASCLLISYPIGSTVQGYFYSSDTSQKVELPVLGINKTGSDGYKDGFDKNLRDDNGKIDDSVRVPKEVDNSLNTEKTRDQTRENPQEVEAIESSSSSDISEVAPVLPNNDTVTPRSNEDTEDMTAQPTQNPQEVEVKPSLAPTLSGNSSNVDLVNSGCDLYQGKWFYDSSGPLYTNNSCPVITQMQNCQGNGRPDHEYENWRWKPSQCDLPRFDAKKFLELMRGKTLAFIGDSVGRNQMESLLCILWQVEVPKNRGNRKMQRWYFRSTSVMIVRMWSSWLIHKTSQPLDIAPETVVKLHLDAPDEFFMDFIFGFDVIVLSSGHWFAKQSVYMLNNQVVGGQLWWPDKSRPMKVNNIEAFGISVETILTAMATHPNYTGLTLVRSYSPDHYEGGAWNTGGSCTGKVKPVADGELAENKFTKIMYEKQVAGFNRAVKKATNKSKLRLMDITEAFGYRHDGHPGPYRSPDPNKITKRGPDGKPPPQDCLHWCMPGPVDTWNELVLENIRREFEGSNQNSSS